MLQLLFYLDDFRGHCTRMYYLILQTLSLNSKALLTGIVY